MPKSVQPDIKKKKRTKHTRLPNGFGSITTLSGNRRNPYWARKTVGFDDETGHPIYETIGYFPDYIAAFQALSEYNKNPYDINLSRMTFAEVYSKWSKRKFNEVKNGRRLSEASIVSYQAAYKHCKNLYGLPFIELNTLHLQRVIDDCKRGRATLENIKLLFNQMYKYAVEFDIVQKDYSKFVVLTKADEKSTKTPFADAEVRALESHRGNGSADLALIMLYSGMRISEVLLMEKENIHLEEHYMVGGVKTEAGKNRIIPIHPKIEDIIKRMAEDQTPLFSSSRDAERKKFKDFMTSLGMNHLPHECRHTFISKADSVGMNETALKMIVGHVRNDITKDVYTHKTPEELYQEIVKISY